MAGSTANLDVWTGADVYSAAVGTTLPTDISTSLNVAFTAVGLLSDASGLVLARSDDQTDITAWGVGVVRTTRKNHKRTFTFVALEDTLKVFGLVNPGSTSAVAGSVTTRTVKTPKNTNPQAWVFQLTDGTTTKRIAIPKGEVTAVGDITYSDENLEAKEITVTVYGAADGTLYYEITDLAGAGT